MQFSRLTRVPLFLASIEISELLKGTIEDREARDLLLLRSAEGLRSAFQPPALIGRISRNRFGLITGGLTETTLEANLNQAALAIERAALPEGPHSATVRFSLEPIRPDINLEELLGEDEIAGSSHARAKTAILAD